MIKGLVIDDNFSNLDLNKKFKNALDLIENSNKNIFITGKAGTGKSTLLSFCVYKTQKNIVVLAPTGVAAINVGGQTIHSFFKFKPDVTLDKIRKVKNDKIYKKIDTIIIDEISMVRADIIDCIDKFLRLNGKNKNEKFGGIQMIFIGDLYQLEPVITRDERKFFYKIYETPYFFSSKVFKNFDFEYIELEKIYRQKDKDFINILNLIRENRIDYKTLNILNKNINNKIKENNFTIYLTTTNELSDKINDEKLEKLNNNLYKSEYLIKGNFDEKSLPNNKNLYYKEGSQIMMLNNDLGFRWVNGTVGVIKRIENNPAGEDIIIIELQNGKEVEVIKHTWDLYKYEYNEKENIIESKIIGSFNQYPFKLAWAVTIHKSQGKTFNNVIIDLGRGAFASGQLYVALSRCTKLEGIVLKTKIEKKDIILDNRINIFFNLLELKEAQKKLSIKKITTIINNAIIKNKNLIINYLKENNEKEKIEVTPKNLKEMNYKNEKYLGLKSFCKNKNCHLNLKIDRILEIKLL